MKKLILVALALAFVASSAFAQEYGLKWVRAAQHITTKTTTNVVASTVTLHTLIISTSNAGTSWTLTVQDKSTTPKILYVGTVSVSTIVIELPVGIVMTGGIDLVTAGSTAGVMDVWESYH